MTREKNSVDIFPLDADRFCNYMPDIINSVIERIYSQCKIK